MRKFGIIGYPLGHSFSRGYFTEKFAREHIDAVYEAFPMESITAFPALVAGEPDLCGLNVTLPHKQAVMQYLDSLSPEAAAIGAVNVIKIVRRDGRPVMKGYNSDCMGFRGSIAPAIEAMRAGGETLQALVFGTGGASRAVAYALLQLNVQPVMVSRQTSPYRLGDGTQLDCMSYDDLTPQVMASHRVLVNATPLGMSPHVETFVPIPYQCLTGKHLLYDLVYNPEETMFLRQGKEQGAQTLSGLAMLYLQAQGSWQVWSKSTL